ncbi:MAG: FGGY-family carbohydrate kinase [Actinomycetota bacterium]|nr:FGGY-family carbohydrate kinase [Actinomycetota bacterium]
MSRLLAAGVDLGGSAVKAWVAEIGGTVLAEVTRGVQVHRPRPGVAELDPGVWWRATRAAMAGAVERAARPSGDYAGITASSLRQGFILTDGTTELGPAVLNSDRRGAGQLDRLRREVGVDVLYATTGHWPAPELTLPKLLHLAEIEPARWAGARRVLFVHDWVLWRLSGAEVTEASLASAGQMLDVARRRWAVDLLEGLGLATDKLAPLVEAGTVVGHLLVADLGLPVGLPVVSGGGDTQMAAMGSGGLDDGVVTVVAGSSTPVQAATAAPPQDPQRHPWVSTHLAPDRWAVETNAAYPGTMLGWLAGVQRCGVDELWARAATSPPGANGVTAVVAAPTWSEEAWVTRAPHTVVGITPSATDADLARAFVEAHAFAVRANVADLERVLGRRADRLVVTGGAARQGDLPRLVADVAGRDVTVPATTQPAALAGAALVGRACGIGASLMEATGSEVVSASDPAPYEEPYQRYLAAHEALRAHLPELGG